MQITTLAIDLAKNIFRVHGCDGNGKAVLRKQLGRRQLLSFVANLPRCVVAMEVCATAHYWAREIEPGTPHWTEVREAVRQSQQERRQRC